MKFILVEALGNDVEKTVRDIMSRIDNETNGKVKEYNISYDIDGFSDTGKHILEVTAKNPLNGEEFLFIQMILPKEIDNYVIEEIRNNISDGIRDLEIKEINMDRWIENNRPGLISRYKNPKERRRVAYRIFKAEREERGEMGESLITEVYPNKGESKDDFISRFMSVTKNEYPDQKQRYAVALSYWDRRNKSKKK